MKSQGRPIEALIAFVAAWLALLPVRTLLSDASWVVPALVISGIVVATGIFVRTMVRHWLAVTLAQVVAGLEAIALWHGRGHTTYGMPTWDTVLALNNILIEARETVLRYAAPAPTNRGMIVAMSFIAVAIVIIVDLLAVTLKAPAAAGLALVTAFLITAANRGSALPFAYFVLPAAAWLVLLGRTGTQGLRRWATLLPKTPDGQEAPRDPRTAFTRSAGRLGVGVLALAVVLPIVVPHFHTRYLTDGLGRSAGAGNGTFSLSTTLDLRANLESQSTSPALKYRTSVTSPGPLRVAILTNYVNGQFTPRPLYPAKTIKPTIPLRMNEALTWWQPLMSKLPAGARKDGTFEAYDSDLASPQIAMPYGARYLSIDDDIEAVEFADSSVEVIDRATSYAVDLTVLNPTPEILDQAPDVDSPGRVDSDSVTADTLSVDPLSVPIISEISERLRTDARNNLEMAVAIQDWLRSDEFTYSLDLAPVQSVEGVPLDPITNFLTTKQGYCQQFASAMILMARYNGIPARMAIGFLPGSQERGEWTVKRSDAHAWPELYFANVGWVRFDPTPGTRSGTAPGYARVPVDTTATTSSSSSTSKAPTTRPTRPQDQLDPTLGGTGTRSLGQRIAALPTTVWVGLGLLAGVLALLVLPVSSLLARRRRLAEADSDAEVIEARWQDLIARIADLGIETPQTLTPRQVHSHLTHTAVLDRDTSAALSRVVDAVEVARYAAPGGTVGDPAADVERVFGHIDSSRSRRIRARARLVPYAGRRAARSAYSRVVGLPARLVAEMRTRREG